jgi:hypothetical protein
MKPNWMLTLEPLEPREVPAVFGTPWPNASSLTLSFAPDGTRIGGISQDALGNDQPSRLFAQMAGAGTPAQWQTEILRAFQTWAVNANINIGLVPDAGSPFGPQSTAPGAGSVGDIRVGAFSASPDVIAVNQPYNLVNPAWSGGLLYNTAKSFSIGSQTDTFNIYSATLDEAGNILGLADTTDPTSALYGHYVGLRSGLNAADVAAIQSLYGGPRTPDAFGNDHTLASAYRLNPYTSPTDATKKMVSATGADLTTLSDVDYYVFKTLADTTSLTVRLETVGKSLLAAKVSVYDDQNALVATATSAGPLATQDIVVTLTGVRSGKDYRVKVEKATNDVFGIGRYDLKVGYNFDPTGAVAATAATAFNADGGTNETIGTASTLPAVGGSANKRYVYNARIESASDVDFYRLNSPSSTPVPMTVIVDPAIAYGLYTKVTVYDASGAVVPAEVLANGANGRLVLQVANPLPSKAYFLKVASVGRNGSGLTGDYTLKVDFTIPAVPLSTVASDILTAAQATAYRTLTVPEAKLFHYTLKATTANPSVVSGVRLVIFDAGGLVVATMTADAGTTTSGEVFLNAGTYYLRFDAATKNGETLPNLTYTLRTLVLSDPIDPYAPPDPTAPPPPDYQVQQDPNLVYTSLTLIDPWTTPWQP